MFVNKASPKDVKNNIVIYFDSFGVEHTPKETEVFISHPSYINTNILRSQAYDPTICGYFCIKFIDLMLAEKTLTTFTNIFSPNNFTKNGDIILNCFYELCLKMAETHSIYSDLSDQPFRLKRINEIKDYYFVAEIKER